MAHTAFTFARASKAYSVPLRKSEKLVEPPVPTVTQDVSGGTELPNANR